MTDEQARKTVYRLAAEHLERLLDEPHGLVPAQARALRLLIDALEAAAEVPLTDAPE